MSSSGVKATFDTIFECYYSRLVAYGTLFVDKGSAEDIVQDIFANLWGNADRIHIHTSLESYLFTSTYRRCLNHLKRSKTDLNNQLADIGAELWDPDSNEAVKKLYTDELRSSIDNAIAALPERCRQVFVLSYIHLLKNRDIAGTLGISENTVETHISNALKTLRKNLLNYNQKKS